MEATKATPTEELASQQLRDACKLQRVEMRLRSELDLAREKVSQLRAEWDQACQERDSWFRELPLFDKVR